MHEGADVEPAAGQAAPPDRAGGRRAEPDRPAGAVPLPLALPTAPARAVRRRGAPALRLRRRAWSSPPLRARALADVRRGDSPGGRSGRGGVGSDGRCRRAPLRHPGCGNRLESGAAVSGGTRESRCERAQVWAALAPDGELAVLERRLLDAHLAHCARCRAFAQQVAAVAAAVRGAAAELCRVHVALGCRLASSATNRPERALR